MIIVDTESRQHTLSALERAGDRQNDLKQRCPGGLV